MTQVLTYYTN